MIWLLLRRPLNALKGAFAFLTTIPVQWPEGVEPGKTFTYFPIVGLVIGCGLALLAAVIAPIFPPDVAAFFVLAAWIAITGGLHLEGWADSCDGLIAAVEPARRLEIMRDSRAGSWALIWTATLLIGKWAAIKALLGVPVMLILPPVMGRWLMVLAAHGFDYARREGLGGTFRAGLEKREVAISTIFAFLIALVALGLAEFRFLVLFAFFGVTVLVLLALRWAAARLGGGLTGDVYGAACELTELIMLIVFCTAR
jgi:adenosylcobinamide-GDP ribazoletransferase